MSTPRLGTSHEEGEVWDARPERSQTSTIKNIVFQFGDAVDVSKNWRICRGLWKHDAKIIRLLWQLKSHGK